MVGPRDRVEVDDAADGGAFEQHQGRTDDPRHADVLGGAGQAVLGEARQQGEVAAQPRARRAGGGVPVGVRVAETPAQVDGGDEVVAGRGVEARQQARSRPAEHRDREVAGGRAGVGVAADHRDAVERGGVGQAGQDRVCGPGLPGPEGVDDGERAPAHGGDVAQVDHDPAIAREVRIVGHEAVEEALDGQQQVPVAVGDRRAIVADRHGRVPAPEPEPPHHRVDVALVADPAGLADLAGQRPDVDPGGHAALRKVRRPCSGSCIGG